MGAYNKSCFISSKSKPFVTYSTVVLLSIERLAHPELEGKRNNYLQCRWGDPFVLWSVCCCAAPSLRASQYCTLPICTKSCPPQVPPRGYDSPTVLDQAGQPANFWRQHDTNRFQNSDQQVSVLARRCCWPRLLVVGVQFQPLMFNQSILNRNTFEVKYLYGTINKTV